VKVKSEDGSGNLEFALREKVKTESHDVKPNLVPFSGAPRNLPIQLLPRHLTCPKKFTCDVCYKGVGTRGGLVYHMKAHLFGRPFKCQICKRSYATKNDFDTHNQRHANKKFTCHLCGSFYKTKQYLADHICAVHLPKVIRCKLCPTPKFFATSGCLKKHIINHLKKKKKSVPKFHCKICGISFTSKKPFDKHCAMRELVKYECVLCHEKFPCYRLLTEHRNKERNQVTFCQLCKKNVKDIYKHKMKTHAEYKCDLCEFKANSSGALFSHTAKCGNEEEILSLKIHCKLCDKYFRTNHLLKKHINLMHGAFKCGSCMKVYHSEQSLRHHLKIWFKKLAPYKCILCPIYKQFKARENFNKHFYQQHCVGKYKKRTKNTVRCDKCQYLMKTKNYIVEHIASCYKLNLP